MSNTETRSYALEEVEIRKTDKGSTLVGYAAVFNSLSENLGGFREKIRPGAFTRSLNEGRDVIANVDHSKNPLDMLGRRESKTLRLTPNQKGLAVEIDLPDTRAGNDVRALMARGDLNKMSFEFKAKEDAWSNIDGVQIRELVDVDLLDVAVVVKPAYSATEVALRSMKQHEQRMNEEKEECFGEMNLLDLEIRLREIS